MEYEAFRLKWKREAALLREQSKDLRFVGAYDTARIADAKAVVIEEMLDELDVLTTTLPAVAQARE